LKRKIQEICGYFVVVVLLLSPSLKVCDSSNKDEYNPHSLSGNFSLSNTPESALLFSFGISGIGLTYNLTISLQSNSTSNVSFSIFNNTGKHIEGWKIFTLSPNETRTEMYVSHYTSDVIPLRSAYYQLIDGTKNASGTFLLQEVHGGYNIPTVTIVTGPIYIENITAWLESLSRTKSISTSQSLIFKPSLYGVSFLIVLFSLVWYRRRGNNREDRRV
jgi:hypothetical protein